MQPGAGRHPPSSFDLCTLIFRIPYPQLYCTPVSSTVEQQQKIIAAAATTAAAATAAAIRKRRAYRTLATANHRQLLSNLAEQASLLNLNFQFKTEKRTSQYRFELVRNTYVKEGPFTTVYLSSTPQCEPAPVHIRRPTPPSSFDLCTLIFRIPYPQLYCTPVSSTVEQQQRCQTLCADGACTQCQWLCSNSPPTPPFRCLHVHPRIYPTLRFCVKIQKYIREKKSNSDNTSSTSSAW